MIKCFESFLGCCLIKSPQNSGLRIASRAAAQSAAGRSLHTPGLEYNN